jgi:hypothetical protein
MKKTLTWLTLFGLWGSIIAPYFSIGSLNVYITTPLSLLILVVVFFMAVKEGRIYLSPLFLIVLLICLIIFFSVLNSWLIGLVPINYRDFNEIIKYAQYLPYLLAISFLSADFSSKFEATCKAAILMFFLAGIMQVTGFNYLTYIYLGSESVHLDSVLNGYRLTITGSDPNVGAVIAAFLSAASFIYFSQKSGSYFWFFMSSFMFYIILTTQSRTVLIGYIFSFCLWFIIYYNIKVFYKFFGFILIIILGVYLFTTLDLDYIILGFQLTMTGDNTSLNIRIENLAFAYSSLLQSPLFGIGPSKSMNSTIIDSEYALIMQYYGILGIAVFTLLVGYLFYFARKNRVINDSGILLIFMLMTPFVMVTNNIFSGYQLMSIPILLYLSINSQLKRYKISYLGGLRHEV